MGLLIIVYTNNSVKNVNMLAIALIIFTVLVEISLL